jgi:UDP-N-acetylglucosamine 2-epimerase (non-hydrolysing)
VRILAPVGTRPEIIKMAPVVRALRNQHEIVVVATGQHYDPELTDVFYEELGMRPDRVDSLLGTESQRYGALITHAIETVTSLRPDLVLLLGDTNTVPAYCLASRGANSPIAHLEAGLRSFNPTSIEEVNRRVAAATASLHLAPTPQAAQFLRAEGVPSNRVFVVGNPVCDALRQLGVTRAPLAERRGVLVTAHRATNVDNPARLEELARMVGLVAQEVGPVTFPLHPRTRKRLAEADLLRGLQRADVNMLDPLPYSRLLDHLRLAKVVITDSGGLQEEAAWLGVPVVVLRRSTPRWEGVLAGTSVLTGMDAQRALKAAAALAETPLQLRAFAATCPYGDGHTGSRVRELLDDPDVLALLPFEEPDFIDQRPPA